MFEKVSTTSIVAILIVLFGMGILYLIVLFNVPEDNTRATQVITGTFGLLMAIVGYYFGASKQHNAVAAGTATVDISATTSTTSTENGTDT